MLIARDERPADLGNLGSRPVSDRARRRAREPNSTSLANAPWRAIPARSNSAPPLAPRRAAQSQSQRKRVVRVQPERERADESDCQRNPDGDALAFTALHKLTIRRQLPESRRTRFRHPVSTVFTPERACDTKQRHPEGGRDAIWAAFRGANYRSFGGAVAPSLFSRTIFCAGGIRPSGFTCISGAVADRVRVCARLPSWPVGPRAK